jgi:copper chaperone CopZ
MEKQDLTRKALLDLQGAHCASCIYTIEHFGRKTKGISDIHVDAATSKIHVEYDGNEEALQSIVKIIRRIGYDADVISSSTL